MWVGYAEFLVFLFIPGLALSELFNLRLGSLVENLALVLGLGFSLDTIFLMLMTSGMTVNGIRLVGIPATNVQLAILLWLLVFLVGLAVRRRISFYVKPSLIDVSVLLLMLFQSLLVASHFAKFPIFPEFSSADFTQHVMIARDLQAGVVSSIPGGILYYGVHGFIASLQTLAGGLQLVVAQRAMAILVALSPALFFGAVCSASNSKRVALLATFVYVFGAFIWFGSVFDAGLYPNFYGVISILFIFIALPTVLERPKSPSSWLVYSASMTNAYFSHYSALTVMLPLLALPVLDSILTRKPSYPSVAAAIILAAPAAIAIASSPNLVNTLVGFVTAPGGGNVPSDTTLSSALTWFPFLRYTVVEITSDSASLIILALAVIGAYRALKEHNRLSWLALFWLASVTLSAPLSETAWRFAYVGLVPLVILSAIGLDSIVPSHSAVSAVRRRKASRGLGQQRRMVAGLALLALMVAGSWGTSLVEDTISNPIAVGQAQREVYNSMIWFANHTPQGSRLISLTDSNYLYLGFLTGRSAAYVRLVEPQSLVSQLKGQSNVYVVLTGVTTLSRSEVSQASRIAELYAASPSFTLVYNNTDVRIYAIVASV